jgi:effector-binding domain-containing protein
MLASMRRNTTSARMDVDGARPGRAGPGRRSASVRAVLVVAILVVAVGLGCQSVVESGEPVGEPGPAVAAIATDLEVAAPPYDEVDVQWKHRIDQPYVFVEGTGSYTGIGRLLEEVFAAVREQGVEPSGPPFALYYDDPGRTPLAELRMRACLPVAAPLEPRAPLAYEVLESTTVVYAFVAGPYPDVPRAYPALFEYLRQLDWVDVGPIREIYLRNPAETDDWSTLVTEVQIPAAAAR